MRSLFFIALVLVLAKVSYLYPYATPTLSRQPICVVAESAPNTFVNDTVNVLTGSFYLKLPHMSVPGHIPLDFIQYYNSQSRYSSWLVLFPVNSCNDFQRESSRGCTIINALIL